MMGEEIFSADSVSFNDILSELLKACDDEELRKGHTLGWHKSGIQRAVEALAFESYYDDITVFVDINTTCMTAEMPVNLFNIKQIYAFNGECVPASSVKVYWKRLFNNKNGNGTNYTADRREFNASVDPYFPMSWVSTNVFYANEQNGVIMLSSNLNAYSKLKIIGNGAGGIIGDDPVIPRVFRNVIWKWAALRFFRTEMAKGNTVAAAMYKVYDNELYGASRGRNSEWDNAVNHVKRMSTWKRESANLYQEGQRDW